MEGELIFMKIYGYQVESEDLIELQELSIQSNIQDLERLILFLQDVKEQHSKVIAETEMCHSHYRDWDKEWIIGSADIIIVTVPEGK